jgi:hypothetical protein
VPLLSAGLTALSLISARKTAKGRFRPTGSITRGRGQEALLNRTIKSIEQTQFPENLTLRFKADTKRLLQARKRQAGQVFQRGAGPDKATSGRQLRMALEENTARFGLAQTAAQQIGEGQRGTELGRLNRLQGVSSLLSATPGLLSRSDLLRKEISQGDRAAIGRAATTGLRFFAAQRG